MGLRDHSSERDRLAYLTLTIPIASPHICPTLGFRETTQQSRKSDFHTNFNAQTIPSSSNGAHWVSRPSALLLSLFRLSRRPWWAFPYFLVIIMFWVPLGSHHEKARGLFLAARNVKLWWLGWLPAVVAVLGGHWKTRCLRRQRIA